MTDIIRLNNIRIRANHGYYEAERELGQLFEVDVELHLDLGEVLTSDDLNDTVDFEAVYNDIEDIFRNYNHSLVEYVAGKLIDRLLEKHGRLDQVRVRIRKPQIPIKGILDNAEIDLTRSRTK